ncbi:MAG: fimbrial protein [Turicibacter sp.]
MIFKYGSLIRYAVVIFLFFSGLARSIECPGIDVGKTYKCNFGTPTVTGNKFEVFQNVASGSKVGNISFTIPYHCNLNSQLVLSLAIDGPQSAQSDVGNVAYFTTNVNGILLRSQRANEHLTQGGIWGRIPFAVPLKGVRYRHDRPYECISGVGSVNLDVYYFPVDSKPIDVGEYNVSFINSPRISATRWSNSSHDHDSIVTTHLNSFPLKIKKTPCHVNNQDFSLGLFNVNDIMVVKNASISKSINIKLSCESGPARNIEYSFSSQTIINPGGLVDVEKSTNSAEGVAYKVEHMVNGQAFSDIEMNRRERVVVNENELSPSIYLRITPIRRGDIKPGVANIHLTLTLTHN